MAVAERRKWDKKGGKQIKCQIRRREGDLLFAFLWWWWSLKGLDGTDARAILYSQKNPEKVAESPFPPFFEIVVNSPFKNGGGGEFPNIQ